MRTTLGIRTALFALAALAAAGVALAADPPLPRHTLPPSAKGQLVLGLCDGETALEVEGVKEGETLSREQAEQVSQKLMEAWRRKNPDAHWEVTPVRVAQARQVPPKQDTRQPPPPKAPPPAAPEERKPTGPSAESGGREVRTQQGAGVQSGQTYKAFGPREEAIWAASTREVVDEGHRVFHDAEALGGTVGISCDMCHPDAANTHPETYPKFQTQLGRVALLRDMINWCLENPVKAKPMADDDPRMKAMEAYILAQRKGTPLQYGKH